MTSTDRLAEMAAEIERLRARIAEVEEMNAAYRKSLSCRSDQLFEALGRRTQLEKRVAELEAIITVGHGTMGTLQQPDEPATITHNIPPSAPPHDER